MNLKLIPFLLLAVTIFSCQKELSLENTTVTVGGGGTQTNECKACVYIPVCNGSHFTYYDTINGTGGLITDTLQFIKDTSMSGKTFQKFFATGNQSYSYTNCTNGESRLVGFSVVTVGGNNITKVALIQLKANLSVGGSWSDTVINQLGQAIIYNSSIISKGTSSTLNGQTFNDVIHVQIEIGADIPLVGFYVVNSADYYYAKGVGLIEYIATDYLSGNVIQHRTLKSYYIP
ncbi:MAG: hypothetical protein V4722_22945 [Bacteroidota bacterium]